MLSCMTVPSWIEPCNKMSPSRVGVIVSEKSAPRFPLDQVDAHRSPWGHLAGSEYYVLVHSIRKSRVFVWADTNRTIIAQRISPQRGVQAEELAVGDLGIDGQEQAVCLPIAL